MYGNEGIPQKGMMSDSISSSWRKSQQIMCLVVFGHSNIKTMPVLESRLVPVPVLLFWLDFFCYSCQFSIVIPGIHSKCLTLPVTIMYPLWMAVAPIRRSKSSFRNPDSSK